MADLRRLHKAASGHRREVLAARRCGCFYCLATFKPALIAEWTDWGRTAICPRCGIDAVLPLARLRVLREMRRRWFRPIPTPQTAPSPEPAAPASD